MVICSSFLYKLCLFPFFPFIINHGVYACRQIGSAEMRIAEVLRDTTEWPIVLTQISLRGLLFCRGSVR